MRRLAFLLPALSLCAQDPWLDHWSAYRPPWGGAPGWVLASTGTANPPSPDEVLLKLRYGQDIDLPRLSPAVAQALLKRESLPSTTAWVLLSPDGEVKASGPGNPSGEAILGHLRRNSLTPRWERREAFLKDHPDHGEARAEALEEALAVAKFRYSQAALSGKLPTATPEHALPLCKIPNTDAGRALATHLLSGVQAPLKALLGAGDLPGEQDCEALWTLGAGLIPEFQTPLQDLSIALAHQLERDPFRSLMSGSALARLGAEGARSLVELARRRWADPDQPWPALGVLACLTQAQQSLGDAAFLEALETFRLPTQSPRRNPTDEKARQQVQGFLRDLRMPLEAQFERWEALAQSLSELRLSSGSGWDAIKNFQKPNNPKALEQAGIQAIFALPAPPDPPPPVPQRPLRLVLLGQASWATTWMSLKDHAQLAPWGPGDLQWEVADPRLAARMRTHQNWDGTARCALLRGDTLLASTQTCPSPNALATLLATQGPSRLQRLSAYLEHHPEHLDIRRKRLELVRSRLPNPALEPLLVEDAQALETGMDLSPIPGWVPDPALWQWAAQRALPRVEATLQRWPSDPRAWRSWIDWSRLHPQPPSTWALIQRLSPWPDRKSWSAALPQEVHAALAGELRQQGRFEDMRAWFQNAWNLREQKPATTQPSWVKVVGADPRQGWESNLVKPLREALRALGRDAELLALERTWEDLQRRGAKP